MKIIAIINEKGGTAKTTTSVNLAAALGEMGQKVLLVDLDGQAASSRWLGVEGDTRLADALLRGSGLEPLKDVLPGVSLAPASGKLDSISHNLRPTQGSQLRRVLAEVQDQYDYILIDCPPSLGNRLIGNALLAASHAIVPVETSILALDGLRILLTMLDDIRQGFEHEIELIGALGCRFNSRTRLSRLVLAELHRALPGKVFGTAVRETVRIQECPASGESILEYASDCSAAEDYRAVASELVNGLKPCTLDLGFSDLTESDEVDNTDRERVSEFRKLAGEVFHRSHQNTETVDKSVSTETETTPEEPQDTSVESEAPTPPPAAIRSVAITLTPKSPEQDETPQDVQDSAQEPEPDQDEQAEQDVQGSVQEPEADQDDQVDQDVQDSTPEPEVDQNDQVDQDAQGSAPEPEVDQNDQAEQDVQDSTPEPAVAQNNAKPLDFDDDKQNTDTSSSTKKQKSPRNRDNVTVGVAAAVLLGILGIGGWVGFKTLLPAPNPASARPSRVTPPKINSPVVTPKTIEPIKEEPSPPVRREIVITASDDNQDDAPKTDSTPDSTDVMPVKAVPFVEDEPTAKEPTTQPSSKSPTTQPAPEIPLVARAEDYPTDLALTAVMYGKTSRRAIISGTVAYEGDTVKGAKVVKILTDSVEVEANGFRFLLGTGPKPVWLKATRIEPPKETTPDDDASVSDSQE
jgi:chromosome partitioning protein